MDVTLDLTDGIACIRMDDGKKNAITPAAVADLAKALDEAEARADALVLAGRPGSFCAGFDLATMTSGDLQAMNELARGGGRFAMQLYHHFVPIAAQSKAYDPAGAISAGFLDRIVPRGKAEAVALETACELAKLPSAAYAQNKLARRARSLENMASDLEA